MSFADDKKYLNPKSFFGSRGFMLLHLIFMLGIGFTDKYLFVTQRTMKIIFYGFSRQQVCITLFLTTMTYLSK